MADKPRGEELFGLLEPVRTELDAAHRAREAGLAACRRTIRACGRAIRAIHRLQPDDAAALTDEARLALREAQDAMKDHPAIFFAGFLHDAEKEYAEAVLCAAMVSGQPLPACAEVGVQAPAWLNGMAEAASELRRHLLDRMREGDLDRAEQLMREMEDVYDVLVTIDFPDAMVGGLRRTVDSLRAVLERTRSDVTMTSIQMGLRTALESRRGDPASD
jgi:translin